MIPQTPFSELQAYGRWCLPDTNLSEIRSLLRVFRFYLSSSDQIYYFHTYPSSDLLGFILNSLPQSAKTQAQTTSLTYKARNKHRSKAKKS